MLEQVVAHGISHHAVCSMLTQFDTAKFKRQPPSTPTETDALLVWIISTALAGGTLSPATSKAGLTPSAPPPAESSLASPRQQENAAAAPPSRPVSRLAAAAATVALSADASAFGHGHSSHKRKARRSAARGSTPALPKSGHNGDMADEQEPQEFEEVAVEIEQQEERHAKRSRAVSPPLSPLSPPPHSALGATEEQRHVERTMAASPSLSSPVPDATADMDTAPDSPPPTAVRFSPLPSAPADAVSNVYPDSAFVSSPPTPSAGVVASTAATTAATTTAEEGAAAAADVQPEANQLAPVDLASPPPPSRPKPHTARERQQLAAAIAESQADLRKRPLTAVTPEQRKAYTARIDQQLQAASLVLREVPGNGDCLLASVLLGCEASGIDVCKERGLKSAHASCLRVFMAEWIRTHTQQLFDISGGDKSWRGEMLEQSRRTRHGTPRAGSVRMTLADCLDLFADTTRRAWDIPWGATEPDAALTNLGDYMPQLLAAALEIRIVLIKANGPSETAGLRDPFDQLLADPSREIVVVQTVRQNHWNAALPLGVVATRDPIVSTPPPPLPPSSPRARFRDYEAACPVTPASEITSKGAEMQQQQQQQVNEAVRRRIFADPPGQQQRQQQEQIQKLVEQLEHTQASLKESQHQHSAEVLYLKEQHATAMQQANEQHEAALAQLQEDADTAARTVAHTMRRIEELVCVMQQVHQDHTARVREEEDGIPDATGDILQEIAILQSTLRFYGEAPFFDVSQGMVDQWTADIEELETALSAPFRLDSPAPVNAAAAQQVCERLKELLRQLEDAGSELSFMQMLLVVKKLLCVDQLRPSSDDHPPYQVLELLALLMRLTSHDRVWSFVLRLPCSYFGTRKAKMKMKAAGGYVKAARAAAPDVLQQARLLVEQCKVLDSGGMLHKAKALNSISLDYPVAPLELLHALHSLYPAAGPPLDRSTLQQFDAEVSEWQAAVVEAERHASRLESCVQDGSSQADPVAAQQARAAADELAAAPPRGFAQCMNKSRVFFHTDKRKGRDQDGSADDQTAQFAQVNEAWDCISACRARFQELRGFQARRAAFGIFDV